MKKRHNFIFGFKHCMAIIAMMVTMVGCNDTAWEDHYQKQDANINSNLLTVLSQDPELSTFVKLLKQTGYDALLDGSESYTVWAPNNQALSLVSSDILNNPDLLKKLIGNHISKFSYNTSSLKVPVLVKMLNNKYIEFANVNGNVTFGDVSLTSKDMLTANGILHKVAGVLNVSPSVWGYLNENTAKFSNLSAFFSKYNVDVFAKENSVRIGTNSLGQAVYDSTFVASNTYFSKIGDLSSEEKRFTFIGLTDAAYTGIYDRFKSYYNYPVADSIKKNTDNTIFSNLNFPNFKLESLNGTAISTTTNNQVVLNPSAVVEDVKLSNGNVLVVNQLDYTPQSIMFKPIRYEIENTARRNLGSLSDFTIQKKYSINASGEFTNVVSLLNDPNTGQTNNYFEILFSNVLSAKYKINLKFTPVGANQQTKLRFEFSYVNASKVTVVNKIDAIVVSNLEDGTIQIGDTYTIPVFINKDLINPYFVKLKVFVDVSQPELLLYERKFGIDYAELVPVE